jgi:hypothetical protein
MALNDVVFTIKKGGLNRQAPSQDSISALMFAVAAPAAYAGAKAKAYTNLADLEADGVIQTNATYAVAWYQCREFFRIAPGEQLYVAFNATHDELRAASGGAIRLIGQNVATTGEVTSVAQAAATAWAAAHAPIQMVVGLDQVSAPVMATIADAATLNAQNVSVVVFGSNSGLAPALATSITKPYIPAVGAVLGAMALARVHESIAWVEKFNLSDGSELETVRLADGAVPTDSILTALDTKRFIVGRKHVGIGGTYLNDSHTATTATNDFAMIETNRTVQKARRLVRSALLPALGRPILVEPTSGKLEAGVVAEIEAIAEAGLQPLLQGGEVSGLYVYINPNQNILSTSVLNVDVRIVPIGIARNITVTIGVALKLG